ncbi:bifunctional NAD(P)H-hydrate repair enzyme [Shewanella sairae]|uniref:Bifunctional NAD(P)H-hydrate repair enzyme n=1 Tax=Shewanella sairae TaxID=190310 RepID=A0ABQ4P1E2_9GAMM|nr:NAD(P)H-hydrate dehydratase [Shewanella sairae]MCL1129817.1 NAD(P)H-hydrate dehydratase [Shewanella sairae]GIU41331.1 bifunctional NAD(P)H-hydrate repair enzyme [Shewanella sairae]
MIEHSLVSMPLFTAEQIRSAEINAVKSGGISLSQLVDQAAEAAFLLFKQKQQTATKVLVLAGHGNNAADAFITATLLLEAGIDVLLQASSASKPSEELVWAINSFQQAGGLISQFDENAIEQAELIIDGLLGTGIRGELSSELVGIINAINRSQAWILSLDLPSGINPNTGSFAQVAVKADVTLTFGGIKQGLLTSRARHYCGELSVASLGLNEFLPETNTQKMCRNTLKGVFSPRKRDAHKGHNGKVSIIGGDYGMAGAVRLAAEGCLKSGAGLVTVISRPDHQFIVSATRPELMFWGCELVDMEVYLKLGWASVLVIGPGLGTNDWGYNLLKAVELTDKPCVIDADGLNLLKSMPISRSNYVLTPHPGEAARLLGISVGEVEQDRFKAAKDLHRKYGGVIVLKGAGTIIVNDEKCIVAPVGNPGLASGGCGDVLAGIIGGLIAQGISNMDAACLGVIIHGEAADLAAQSGERGMLASDLMPYIRQLVNEI